MRRIDTLYWIVHSLHLWTAWGVEVNIKTVTIFKADSQENSFSDILQWILEVILNQVPTMLDGPSAMAERWFCVITTKNLQPIVLEHCRD